MTTKRMETAQRLKPRTKAARLRALMGLIEAKLGEGVQHADILQWLNDEAGLELTERTYQSYLYRYRRRREEARAGRKKEPAVQPAASCRFTAAPEGGAADPGRPATFDYDPRGIPDLLK
jgi:hypothetical protein